MTGWKNGRRSLWTRDARPWGNCGGSAVPGGADDAGRAHGPVCRRTGRYRDRFRDMDGALLLAERVVVCDSSHFDTLVAIPL
jgi:hypothetical protein